MNPLILSLVCLLLVGVSANWLSIVKNNKTLIYLSLAPCIYIAIYGVYLVIGPVDLYEDGSKNFFMQNPYESELPPQFFDHRKRSSLFFVTANIIAFAFAFLDL